MEQFLLTVIAGVLVALIVHFLFVLCAIISLMARHELSHGGPSE